MKKNYKFISLFIAVIVILIGIFTWIFMQKKQNIVSQVDTQSLPYVSMIDLISNPDKYDEKIVVLSGVSSIAFEDTAIYLSTNDYRYLNSKNAIWTDIENIKSFINMDGKYVTIQGIFDKDNKGHMNAYSGAIKSITVYEEAFDYRTNNQNSNINKMDL